MRRKGLLVPVAAFVLAATSMNTFDPEMLQRIGLEDRQIEAFVEAHKLKQQGDRNAARDILADAGIDLDTLEEMRNAIQSERT